MIILDWYRWKMDFKPYSDRKFLNLPAYFRKIDVLFLYYSMLRFPGVCER